MTLTEFLLARITEDEWEVKPFVNGLGEPSRWTCDEVGGNVREGRGNQVVARGEIHLYAEHIARYDPERVLAECEAKRRIVDYHAMLSDQAEHSELAGYHATGLGLAIKRLAEVYADHPDYQQEWRP